jgi:hypothetical protein
MAVRRPAGAEGGGRGTRAGACCGAEVAPPERARRAVVAAGAAATRSVTVDRETHDKLRQLQDLRCRAGGIRRSSSRAIDVLLEQTLARKAALVEAAGRGRPGNGPGTSGGGPARGVEAGRCAVCVRRWRGAALLGEGVARVSPPDELGARGRARGGRDGAPLSGAQPLPGRARLRRGVHRGAAGRWVVAGGRGRSRRVAGAGVSKIVQEVGAVQGGRARMSPQKPESGGGRCRGSVKPRTTAGGAAVV